MEYQLTLILGSEMYDRLGIRYQETPLEILIRETATAHGLELPKPDPKETGQH